MTNLFTLMSILSLLSTSPSIDFNTIIDHCSYEDIAIIENNNIDDWSSYSDYVSNNESYTMLYSKNNDNQGIDLLSGKIINIKDHLNEFYPDYHWVRDHTRCALTSDVSNCIPIEMQSEDFKKTEIEEAIKAANVEDYTSYGGCGPIATLGILDYFSRYLGYKEIISDPTDPSQRISLATDVLKNTIFSIYGNNSETLVWPWNNVSTFNSLIERKGLGDIISAENNTSLFGGQKNKYWKMITENINEGLPVTLFTGLVSGSGEFSKHYTNIYGYDTWIGVTNTGFKKIEKTFIKARLNWRETEEYYCNGDILNCGQIGLITYNVNYSLLNKFYSSDFSKDFLNSSGMGQYFFNEKSADVELSNKVKIFTNRLRTSYIENEYLVLSPNRENAGKAFLDITFPHSVSKMSFDTAMWSGLEGQINEEFIIQYMTSAGWKDHIPISLTDLTTLRDYPQTIKVLFPKNTNRIKLLANHYKPSGNRNKGRIILDNFEINYN